MNDKELVDALDKLKATMIAVATGGPRIGEVQADFANRYDEVAAELVRRKIPNTIPYRELWDWYGRWSAGDMRSWQSRRDFVNGIFRDVANQIVLQRAPEANPERQMASPEMTADDTVPRCFISYSHDSEVHKAWVLTLATRLRTDGVDVTLDRWDVRFGTDLPSFMERAVSGAATFVAVCTPPYVAKADAGKGGAGYEKTILTAALVKSIDAKRVIPVWRDNPEKTLPTFVAGRLAANFNDDKKFEGAYSELLRTLHGLSPVSKPPIGRNPFVDNDVRDFDPVTSNLPSRYVAPELEGEVTFDYSNNDGRFTIGSGEMQFDTAWSRGGGSSIHIYRSDTLQTIALAVGIAAFGDIKDARLFDASSRVRTPQTGEFVVLENKRGYFAALHVIAINSRGHGGQSDSVTFKYRIQSNRTPSFG